MKPFFRLFMGAGVIICLAISVPEARAVDYMTPEPMAELVKASVRDCGPGELRIPVIAWGGDIATSLANGDADRTAPNSILGKAGLDVTLYRQDDFAKQVEDYLTCKTPFLRGTMGMINMAAEVANRDPRTAMVLVYQMTWSNGGDALVVKQGIDKPADLRGKTVAVQAYGPHVDYLTRMLADAGLTPQDVEIKWLPDLIQVDENSSSPAMALRQDQGVDAAFVIIPDALALTSGGNVGDGSEDSVKGARILLSTRTANRVIADVYAVRADYLEANRDMVRAFVNGLMQAGERLQALMKNRQDRKADYQEVIAAAAELLLDSRNAVEDTAAMYGDAEFVGYPGNVKFFDDPAYPRNFERLSEEIQTAYQGLGFLSKRTPLGHARWDFARLAAGVSDTAGVEAPKFDTAAVQQLMQRRQKQASLSEGELFRLEIYFSPNQNVFPVDLYQATFEELIGLASTYGGALLTVEGHSDPLGYLRKKKGGESSMVLQQVKQAARNLSFTRANAVKESIIRFAASKGITLDPTQFGVMGWGVMQPNTPNCTYDERGDISPSCAPLNETEWNATRRVVFRILQVEAEADVFEPL
jgi:ABC-type nitrate/sulfonate/bicarbonate transport system substrate-binding protein/outer membrane protein OmpA-like peptidoglycan-associated protein